MSSNIGIDTILDADVVGSPAVIEWDNLDQAIGVVDAYAIIAVSIPVSTGTFPSVTLGGVAAEYTSIGQSALGERTTAFAAVPTAGLANKTLTIAWGAGGGAVFNVYGICIRNTRQVEGFLDFVVIIRGDSNSPLGLAHNFGFPDRILIIHAGVFNTSEVSFPMQSRFGASGSWPETAMYLDTNKSVVGGKHMEFAIHEYMDTGTFQDYQIMTSSDADWRSGYVLLVPDADLFYVGPSAFCSGLDEVVMYLCVRAGVDPRNVNVERLSSEVRGFVITATYPCSESLRALSQVFMFEPVSYDKQIHFVPRGADTTFSITEEDMVDTEDEIEQQRRSDSIVIPRVLHLNYHDRRGSLATDKQSSERAGDHRATGEISIQTVVLMESYEAAQAVAINHKIMIEEAKGELKFSLPDSFISIIPTDTGFVQHDDRVDRVRVIKIDIQDGYQEYTCVRDRQSTLTSTAEGIPPSYQVPPPSAVIGPTIIEPLDMHILRDVDDSAGLSMYIAVSGIDDTWSGATIELSYDGGENYVASDTARVEAIIGELTSALGDHPIEYPDYINTTSVRTLTPDAVLQSTTLLGMQNRVNRAIIGDEIVNFQDVDETSEGLWALSGFLRGRLGTQSVAHSAGERFVLLERNFLVVQPTSATDIGRTITLRATSLGADPVTSGTVVSFVYVGRSQVERPAGYLSARRDGANMVVTWQGVGRLGGGAAAAHGIRFDGYLVTFGDNVNPDIVVETDNQELTQDVSSLTSSPITVFVQQVNSLTGNGPAVEVIIA